MTSSRKTYILDGKVVTLPEPADQSSEWFDSPNWPDEYKEVINAWKDFHKRVETSQPFDTFLANFFIEQQVKGSPVSLN